MIALLGACAATLAVQAILVYCKVQLAVTGISLQVALCSDRDFAEGMKSQDGDVQATDEELERAHTAEHVRHISGPRKDGDWLVGDNFYSELTPTAARYAAGCTVQVQSVPDAPWAGLTCSGPMQTTASGVCCGADLQQPACILPGPNISSRSDSSMVTQAVALCKMPLNLRMSALSCRQCRRCAAGT